MIFPCCYFIWYYSKEYAKLVKKLITVDNCIVEIFFVSATLSLQIKI